MLQVQTKLEQSILEWKEFQFLQVKDHAIFQSEIIMKKRKYIIDIKKSVSAEPLGQLQPNLAQSILS